MSIRKGHTKRAYEKTKYLFRRRKSQARKNAFIVVCSRHIHCGFRFFFHKNKFLNPTNCDTELQKETHLSDIKEETLPLFNVIIAMLVCVIHEQHVSTVKFSVDSSRYFNSMVYVDIVVTLG